MAMSVVSPTAIRGAQAFEATRPQEAVAGSEAVDAYDQTAASRASQRSVHNLGITNAETPS